MRHAKSDWDEAGLSDHDRPLNARGRRTAPQMAKWIEKHDAVPEIILASTALRVRETVALLLQAWQSKPLVLSIGSLYLASPQTILEHIRTQAIDDNGRRPKRLLVVGHNPGMEQLTSSLAGVHVPMPTAAIALYRCEPMRLDDEDAPRVIQMLAAGRPKEL